MNEMEALVQTDQRLFLGSIGDGELALPFIKTGLEGWGKTGASLRSAPVDPIFGSLTANILLVSLSKPRRETITFGINVSIHYSISSYHNRRRPEM